MQKPINTREPALVEEEVQQAYLEMFPQGNREFIPQLFHRALDWFGGHYRDYQPIDAHYHDLEHTLQGVLCMARLLRGRHSAGVKPQFSEREAQLGLVGILFHDT